MADPVTPWLIPTLLGGASLLPSLAGGTQETVTTKPVYKFDPKAQKYLRKAEKSRLSPMVQQYRQGIMQYDPLESAGYEKYRQGLMGQFREEVAPQVIEPFAAAGRLRGSAYQGAAGRAAGMMGNILAQQALPMQEAQLGRQYGMAGMMAQEEQNRLMRLLQMAQLRQSGWMMPGAQTQMTPYGGFAAGLPGMIGQILGGGIGAGWFG